MNRRAFVGAALVASLPHIAVATMRRSGPDPILDPWVARHRFAGVVAQARRGRLTDARAFGLASIEERTPTTVATRYAIGSVSKWFSTLVVLRLAGRGAVDLDAPIGRDLPGLSGPAATQVRLVDLLANRSGIPDRLTAAVRQDPALRTTTDTAASLALRFANGPLAAAPNSVFDYAVLNWVLVRAIVEQVTGLAFADAVRREVLTPLKLGQTGVAEAGFAAVPDLAPAYAQVDPPRRKADPVGPAMAASGTFVSSAGDLLRAAHLVFATDFLSPPARARLLEIRSPGSEYALGGRVHRIAGRDWAWEQGKIGGYRTHLAHDLARDRGIVLLGNSDLPQDAISQLVEQLAVRD
jgi:CubicO group peptidase (beta-lactamase class C family)